MNDVQQPERQPDQLNDDETPSTSHSSQPMRGRRVFRRVVPLEEEDTPENSSINVDIFTKVTTNSRTDPATGDIVLVRETVICNRVLLDMSIMVGHRVMMKGKTLQVALPVSTV